MQLEATCAVHRRPWGAGGERAWRGPGCLWGQPAPGVATVRCFKRYLSCIPSGAFTGT